MVSGRLERPEGDVRRGGRAAARRSASTPAIELALREARAGDETQLASLLDELGYPTAPKQAAERVARIAGDDSTLVLVADVAGEIVGLAALHVQNLVERDEPGCELAAMVVGERFRRLGVGKRLMAEIEREACSRGCANLVLNTHERRADAHAFYESLGYEHTGRRYAKTL